MPSVISNVSRPSASVTGQRAHTTTGVRAHPVRRPVSGWPTPVQLRAAARRIARRERLGRCLLGGSGLAHRSALRAHPGRIAWRNASNAFSNSARASVSATRSCGRAGPANDGSTVDRSSASVSSYTGTRGGVVPQALLLRVRLDERDEIVGPAGRAQVAQRLVVDREHRARRAVLGRHVADRRPVLQRDSPDAFTVELDELPDDAVPAQQLRDGEHEVGRGRPFGQGAPSARCRRPSGGAATAAAPASPPPPRSRRRPSRARRAR